MAAPETNAERRSGSKPGVAKPVIAYVLKGYPRLSETFIINEILLLEQQGHEIHIYALREPGESKIHPNVMRIQAPVNYIPDHFWRGFFELVGSNLQLFANRPLRYWRGFREAAWRSITRSSSSTIKRFVQAGYLVERHLRSSPAAHIHAHFAHGPATTALYAAELAGTDFSFTAHAKDIYVQEEKFLRTKLARARFVVTCTGFNRGTLQKVHDGTPIHRIYHGVDCRHFSPPTKKQRDAAPMLLSVGRLVAKKGFPVLIEAMRLVMERGVDFHWTIVGDGPSRQELALQVEHSGLTDRVTFTGKLAQGAVMDHYAKADCMALACQVQEDGDRDGIPNVLVEAMAMGVPVVSTDISGIPELIDDESTGLLVPSGDSDAMARAVERVFDDSLLAERLSEAGRRKVVGEHDSTTNTRMLGLIFDDVTAAHSLVPAAKPAPRSYSRRPAEENS